ncbi:MAG: presenilin family intramembrane aspartyl protease [archaeon]|nr:presenilin family intramembrane aspartyl protease [archaeon]
MNKELLIQLTIIFFLTQVLGLWAGSFLIDEGIKTTIINDDPESIDNGLALIVWILLMSAVLLLAIKFAPNWILTIFLKALESLAIFGTAIIILLPAMLSDWLVLAIASGLVAARIIFSKHVLLRNVSSIVAAAGAGALIGASLGVVPLLVFIILLSVYDIIAVFKTKHMVELAKGVTKKNLSFTYALPTKEHQFELGTGDMVIPLAFSVSVLAQAKQFYLSAFAFVPPALILIASFVGLALTLEYASKNKGKPLPALPLQTGLMIIVYGIVYFIAL